MATNTELKIILNKKLYDLKKLKKRNPDKEIAELEDMILETEAIMEQEDVAWVDKKIAQLK
ncbi:MAG: hypothetical protein FWC70_03255 [Defluviitaleaceae bacterium]|nr:hypothetical protein [Defluviitaleaceae bacterium]